MDPNQKVLVEFKNKLALKQAYISFVKNGGLFITVPKPIPVDTMVNVELHLMDENEPIDFIGRVVWFTPQNSSQISQARVGLQFVSDNSETLRKKIETYLAGML